MEKARVVGKMDNTDIVRATLTPIMFLSICGGCVDKPRRYVMDGVRE